MVCPQTKTWTINDRTVVAVANALKLSGDCSSIFKYMPHPAKAFTGIGAILAMAVGYASDAIKRSVFDKEYYNSCVLQSAADMREEVFRTTY